MIFKRYLPNIFEILVRQYPLLFYYFLLQLDNCRVKVFIYMRFSLSPCFLYSYMWGADILLCYVGSFLYTVFSLKWDIYRFHRPSRGSDKSARINNEKGTWPYPLYVRQLSGDPSGFEPVSRPVSCQKGTDCFSDPDNS